MGKWVSSNPSFFRVKKRGMRTKTSFGNRFIGGIIDSSERSFGRTFVSNELLIAAIYKHGCELDSTTKMPGGQLAFANLCNRDADRFIVSNHFRVSSLRAVAFMVMNGAYLPSLMYLSSCLSNCRSSFGRSDFLSGPGPLETTVRRGFLEFMRSLGEKT